MNAIYFQLVLFVFYVVALLIISARYARTERVLRAYVAALEKRVIELSGR